MHSDDAEDRAGGVTTPPRGLLNSPAQCLACRRAVHRSMRHRDEQATFKALRLWLDSWRGIGDIEAGMRRQGFDLYLCRYDGRAGEPRSS